MGERREKTGTGTGSRGWKKRVGETGEQGEE